LMANSASSGLDGQAPVLELVTVGLRLLADLPRDAVAEAINDEFAAFRNGVGKTRKKR
jgi:hypothetical protein